MLVHYSRLTVCQSEDTSPAPLLPGVGLHGDTTAEDHWPLHRRHQSCNKQTWPLASSASKRSIRRFTRAFSWLKAASTAFTFKTLLRHYANQALTPR